MDPEGLDRARYSLELEEDFTSGRLDPQRWVDHYLPHWTTPERSAARYRVDGDGLRLLVEADQPAWLPEDGPMRVSNIQSGSWSGAAGDTRGQHHHRPGLVVRSPQPERRLWTPATGLVEVRASATADPTCMLGIWLVGVEADSPAQSGEVCVAELFGHALGSDRSLVRVGIKAHHDPSLRDDMADVPVAIDATKPHTYAAEWDARRTRFHVDHRVVREVDQGIAYPVQLMIDLFEFPETDRRDPADYPRSATVHRVRGYRQTGATSRW